MENPLISVIVPIYNVERYLPKCIESIINSTYTNLEILLIDDGSTDQSAQICSNFTKIDNRILVVTKENGGLSSARNLGLDRAKGKFICFVDADDFIHPEMITVLYKQLADGNTDFAYCQYTKVYENESIQYNNIPQSYTVEEKDRDMAFQTLLSEELEIKLAWNKLYRAELFRDLRYKEGYLHEDEFLIHHLLGKIKKIKKVNVSLYYYLQRQNSIMGSLSLKRVNHTIQAYEDRITFIRSKQKLKRFTDQCILMLLSTCKRLYITSKYCKNNLELRQITNEIETSFAKWYSYISHNKLRFSDKLFRYSAELFWLLYKTDQMKKGRGKS